MAGQTVEAARRWRLTWMQRVRDEAVRLARAARAAADGDDRRLLRGMRREVASAWKQMACAATIDQDVASLCSVPGIGAPEARALAHRLRGLGWERAAERGGLGCGPAAVARLCRAARSLAAWTGTQPDRPPAPRGPLPGAAVLPAPSGPVPPLGSGPGRSGRAVPRCGSAPADPPRAAPPVPLHARLETSPPTAVGTDGGAGSACLAPTGTPSEPLAPGGDGTAAGARPPAAARGGERPGGAPACEGRTPERALSACGGGTGGPRPSGAREWLLFVPGGSSGGAMRRLRLALRAAGRARAPAGGAQRPDAGLSGPQAPQPRPAPAAASAGGSAWDWRLRPALAAGAPGGYALLRAPVALAAAWTLLRVFGCRATLLDRGGYAQDGLAARTAGDGRAAG